MTSSLSPHSYKAHLFLINVEKFLTGISVCCCSVNFLVEFVEIIVTQQSMRILVLHNAIRDFVSDWTECRSRLRHNGLEHHLQGQIELPWEARAIDVGGIAVGALIEVVLEVVKDVFHACGDAKVMAS